MFSPKINRIPARPTLRSVPVDALRPRMAAAESPQVAQVEANPAGHERRLLAERRGADRRAQDLPAFLDTRVSQGRRRSNGRRMTDRNGQLKLAISVKA